MVETSLGSKQDATTQQLYAHLIGNLWTLCDLWVQGETYRGLEALTKVKSGPKNARGVRLLKGYMRGDVDREPVDEIYRRLLVQTVKGMNGEIEGGDEENESQPMARSQGNAKRKRLLGSVDGIDEEEELGGTFGVWFGGMDDFGCVEADEWEETKDKVLGTGTYSQVVKAKLRGIKVAAKVFNRKTTSEQDFLREVKISSRLRHPGIVSYRGYFLGDGRMVLFTEMMRTSVFDEYLSPKNTADEVPINLRLRWCLQVARTIEYLHSIGYVHRDINTKNILLSDAFEARLCDFTFTLPFMTKAALPIHHRRIKLAQDQLITSTVPLHVGTTRYMAPEIAAKITDKEIDFEASDIWSLGHTLLDIITGAKPYEEKEANNELTDFLAAKIGNAAAQDIAVPETYRDERTLKTIPGLERAPADSVKRLFDQLCKCFMINPTLRPSASQIVDCLVLYEKHIYTHAFQDATATVPVKLSSFEFETFAPADPKKLSALLFSGATTRRGNK